MKEWIYVYLCFGLKNVSQDGEGEMKVAYTEWIKAPLWKRWQALC